MTNPVIVVTLFRRPEATRRLLASLSECYGVDECPVYFSVDYDSHYAAAVHAVLEAIQPFSDRRKGRNVRGILNDPRLGIDLHKLKAIPDALKWSGADRFIFLEDDTTISPDALNFFTTTLAATESDPSVLAVCGFNRVPDDHQGSEDVAAEKALAGWQLHGTYRSHAFKPWGWAMTRAQWQRFFGDGGARYCGEVDSPNGRFDWWLTDQCENGGMVTVRPYVARTGHGEWDQAEHTPSESEFLAHEKVSVGAWDYDLPDTGLLNWGK